MDGDGGSDDSEATLAIALVRALATKRGGQEEESANEPYELDSDTPDEDLSRVSQQIVTRSLEHHQVVQTRSLNNMIRLSLQTGTCRMWHCEHATLQDVYTSVALLLRQNSRKLDCAKDGTLLPRDSCCISEFLSYGDWVTVGQSLLPQGFSRDLNSGIRFEDLETRCVACDEDYEFCREEDL